MYDTEKIDSIKQCFGTGSMNIFGRPFAGKDYQGRELSKLLEGNLVGGGEILRGSVIPDHIADIMHQGKLIPSADYVDIVLPFLRKSELAGKPLILSSVGRWHGEEEGVIRALEASSHPLRIVIYLEISDNESHDRWLGRDINNDRNSRQDDTEAVLLTRFKEFEEKTIPVIEYYESLGMLLRIDGRKSRVEVTNDIIDSLYNRCLMH